MNPAPNPDPARYDVIIIGGALSGAASAVILLREQPKLRVLILEKTVSHGRRVGEATIEISTYFLCRVLGLTQYLNENHLNKQGLRFWFSSPETTQLDHCGELGGRYMARVPSYLVDRATLDSEVLRRAVSMGAELWRPATVQKVELNSGKMQHVTVKYQDRTEHLSARWVVDASGVAALLARQNGWHRPNYEHPTTGVWSRWKGVKDWESVEFARKYPEWAKQVHGQRGTATNHLMGHGWWSWWIALKGGDMSVGVVFDQRIVKWPEGGSLGQRLKDFLMKESPVGRELLCDAEWTEGDMHWRKQLPYSSTTFAGDGFSLVGDAAGFIDPFYSPGLDWVSFTSFATCQMILAQQRGEPVEPLVQRHNKDFLQSYYRWFNAIYKDKYEYMGEFDLMRLAFMLDLGLYYMGVASQPFKRGALALVEPYYSTPPSTPFFHFMRAYNRRLAQMARERNSRGVLGQRNKNARFLFPGYTFAPYSAYHIVKAIGWWAKLEITEGWRSWGRFKETIPIAAQTPVAPPVQASSPPPLAAATVPRTAAVAPVESRP